MVNAKIPAYGRHRISQPMQIEVPISTKKELFFGGGETYIWTYLGMDKRTDIRTDKGEDAFYMSRYHLVHVSVLQCNSNLQHSAVQHCSGLVYQKIFKKNYLKRIKLES